MAKSKSIKLKNNTYLDSTSIVDNRNTLDKVINDIKDSIVDNRNALNKLINDVKDSIPEYIYDGKITKTNEFLGDKRIYRKRVIFYTSINNDVITVPHGISDYDYMWIDTANSFLFAKSEGYYRSMPITGDMYMSPTNVEKINAMIDGDNIVFIANSGWGTGWYKAITIKFTYN